ncbi:AcrR family transcriptional regulator [Arthrobacter pigmenti]|uniref:AcrR family transcriptional regulator n=1 Tax=Arthrobacter pigmenti TaxID=271432 RepID=A0A846RRU2_9MICC|nr:TetR/AcrR family transcriptional regulator [Arthrobacter pigmenti]NJC23282.1 AcrR family transcriptional regulator [Arthrobacter pigmenti]
MTRQRQPPLVRRGLIVEAARQVIIRDGLHRTKLRDIAAQAEVSVGTVTYHFKSVDEILSEVAERETERFYTPLLEKARNEPDPVRALTLLIDPLFDGSESTAGHWRLWTDYWTASARRPGMAENDYGRLRVWQACFQETVERGIREGVFSSLASPSAVALKVAAYSDGIATQMGMNADGLDHLVARQWLRQLLTAELDAVFDDAPSGGAQVMASGGGLPRAAKE